MPKSLEPNSRITMVLACDADKPPESQPRIFARTLTLNQQRKVMRALRAMQEASGDPDKMIDAALDAAEVCLTGWENMTDPTTGDPIPFGRDTIGDVLSIEEMTEVFDAVISSGKASPGDQKKSESPHT
jgi:hypothetical protein